MKRLKVLCLFFVMVVSSMFVVVPACGSSGAKLQIQIKRVWDSNASVSYSKVIVDKKTVFLITDKLECFNRETGDYLWGFDLETKRGSVLIGDILNTKDILAFGTSAGSNYLYVIDKKNMKLLMHYTTKKAVLGKPTTDGENLFFSGEGEYITAVNLKEKREKWSLHFDFEPGEITNPVVEAGDCIVYQDNIIFISRGNNRLYSIDKNSGKVVWYMDGVDVESPTVFQKNNKIYILDRYTKLICINPQAKKIVWNKQYYGTTRSNARPVIIDGIFYFITNSYYAGFTSVVYGVNLTDGKTVFEHFVEDEVTDLEVYEDNILFVADSQLYSIKLDKSVNRYPFDVNLSGDINIYGNELYFPSGNGKLFKCQLNPFNEKEKHSSVSQKDKRAIELLIKNYEHSLVEAINKNQFKLVESHLTPGSPLYKSQQKLVANLFKRGIKEKLINFRVEQVKSTENKDTFKAYVFEEIGIKHPDKKSYAVQIGRAHV